MSAFQGVQTAANLGQQNFRQQLALDQRLDNRNDEMWDRYAFEKRIVADQAKQLFYPTIEKMFGQAMEAGPIGEFLSTISGESKVRVAEAVKNAEMSAQERIQRRMIDKAMESGPMMSIAGSTTPEQQVQPEMATGPVAPKTGEMGSPYAGPPEPATEKTPPATAPRSSDVRIPKSATPQQRDAILSVANRSANAAASQRLSYNIPGIDLYPNQLGEGVVARVRSTGKTMIFSDADLRAMQNAVKAENAAIIADSFSTASRNVSKQVVSDAILGENLTQITGRNKRNAALEAGVIDQQTADYMKKYGIIPTEDEWKDLINNHIKIDALIDTVRNRNRNEKSRAIDSQIEENGVLIQALERQLYGNRSSGGSGAGSSWDIGGEIEPIGGAQQQLRQDSQLNELNNLKMRQRRLHTQKRALYNHNIHGTNSNLGSYATASNKQIDMASMNDLMSLTASRLTGYDPEAAMRLLPYHITDSEQFMNEFVPALAIEARAAGWHLDENDPADSLWWAKQYITHVDESVRIEDVREKLAERDAVARKNQEALQDLTVADKAYVEGFRSSMGKR